ncbi:MAG: manno-octulosonate cytidylyltransferase [Pseudomonadota bacterium]
MSVTILIPARYASTRFPGKPLAPLRGSSGVSKTLIHRSWEAAMAVKGVDAVYVATDSEEIAAEARRIGAEVAMTAEHCRNGTERCHDALRSLPEVPDIVINLQGDAPLTPPWFVEAIVAAMRDDPALAVATPVLRCDGATLANFQEDRRAGRVGGTTVVVATTGNALYFSKEVIPYGAEPVAPDAETPVFHHVGLYGYRPAALEAYAEWQPGPLETLEGLEQLRFLENGWPVRAVPVTAPGRVFWELNNPVDTPRIEAALSDLGIE